MDLNPPLHLIKWAGGKTKLLPQITQFFPATCKCLYEPFAGSAALFFGLQHRPESAMLSDMDAELINMYRVVRIAPEALIDELQRHANFDAILGRDWYNTVRARDDSHEHTHHALIKRAAQFIYLNRMGFNGLRRVNAKTGRSNVPYGKHDHSFCVDTDAILRAHTLLGTALLHTMDFAMMEYRPAPGDIVYLDPPYHKTFTGYTKEGFTWADQVRVFTVFKSLWRREVFVAVSNSDTPEIRDLYQGYRIETILRSGSMNSKPLLRQQQKEILILPELTQTRTYSQPPHIIYEQQEFASQ